ncbi:alkaline phosphatase family protein [Cryptosporidium felis]|nr:alkaline phosphatase family protein [Cryptosporidium felis]
MNLAILTLLTLAALIEVRAAKGDGSSNKVLESLVFVSCVDGQRRDESGRLVSQDFWDVVGRERPDALFWMGDSIYTKCGSPVCLREGYSLQKNNKHYKKLLDSGIYVDGTWDDHDYGVNDGGKEVPFKEESQQIFLDFLSVPESSPRRKRSGVYSSHTFGPPGKQVKVIALDTRFHRDGSYVYEKYGISSFAHLDTPFTSIFAASIRFFASVFGYGHSHRGDILGREQWEWLEKELSESRALANIIISSVQVTTSYPVIEGWGHYPKSRERLFRLIKRIKPRGVLFLSGDVHWGQVLELGDSNRSLIEVTSSGMTHSVSNKALDNFVISTTLPLYTGMRLEDGSPSYFIHENYGKLDFEYICPKETRGTGPEGEKGEVCTGIEITASIKDLSGRTRVKKRLIVDQKSVEEERIESISRIPQMITKKSFKQILGRICIIAIPIVWGIQFAVVLIYFSVRYLFTLGKLLGGRQAGRQKRD